MSAGDTESTRSARQRSGPEEAVAFLTDVVVEATRAQQRLPADFDETEF